MWLGLRLAGIPGAWAFSRVDLFRSRSAASPRSARRCWTSRGRPPLGKARPESLHQEERMTRAEPDVLHHRALSTALTIRLNSGKFILASMMLLKKRMAARRRGSVQNHVL